MPARTLRGPRGCFGRTRHCGSGRDPPRVSRPGRPYGWAERLGLPAATSAATATATATTSAATAATAATTGAAAGNVGHEGVVAGRDT